MSGYLSSAQQGRAPFHLIVSLTVCRCESAPEQMATARSVEKLIPAATGYWSLYVAFWGHLPRLLSVSIVDVRDGAVMWRNGKTLLVEDEHGEKFNYGQPDQNAGRHIRSHPGRPATPNRVTGGYGR